LSRIIRRPAPVAVRWVWRSCCGLTSCSSSLTCRIPVWKMRSMTRPRCGACRLVTRRGAQGLGRRWLSGAKRFHPRSCATRARHDLPPHQVQNYVDEQARRKNTTKSRVRAKVEHPFRILKRIFGFDKVRYRDLRKNHNRLCACFALINLYQHRKRLAPLGA
jgi:IS5 family transposase